MQPIAPAAAPYRDPSANRIYELLFCDRPSLFAARNEAAAVYPWNVLLSGEVDLPGLRQIAANENLETRVRLLAYDGLTKEGQANGEKQLLGVIIEVGLDTGLDVVAAYKDGTARYINATGKMIFWDTVTTESELLVDDLFAQSQTVVRQIGPWHGERRPHPEEGMARLTFLVSDGLYFGEGPQSALFNDAMARPVLMAALQLMKFLTETVLETTA